MSETNDIVPLPNGSGLLRGMRDCEAFVSQLEPISQSVNEGEIILKDRYEVHVFLNSDKDISRLRITDGSLVDVYRDRSFRADSVRIIWPDQHNPFKPVAVNLVGYYDQVDEYEVLCVEFGDIDHIDLVDNCSMPGVISAKSIRHDILALREFHLAMSNISDGLEGETVITDENAHFVVEFFGDVRAETINMGEYVRASQIDSMAANIVVFPLDPDMGDVIELRDTRNPEAEIRVEVSFSRVKEIAPHSVNFQGQDNPLN